MKRFADYELVESLGAGNHGEYFVARPPSRLGLDADRVALKVLAVSAGPEARRRVASELALLASITCDQLAPLHDAGHQGGTLFYATDHFAQGALARPAAPPSRAQILRAVADAARAAHALHEAGMVHRNIKPANILLDGDGARLADIGVAQVLSPGQTLTGIGPIDAIEFVEPAALLGQPAGRAADIWSLAITLHRALTGESVYGEIPTDALLGALRHVLETAPKLAAGLSDGEAELLSWCLSPDRRDRPPSAAVLAERLDVLAAGSDEPPTDEFDDLHDLEVFSLSPDAAEPRQALAVESATGTTGATGATGSPQATLPTDEVPTLGFLVFDDGSTFALDGDYVLGREPETDESVATASARPIALDDPDGTVSRVHAEVRLVAPDVQLVDRGSTNGTHLWDESKHAWERLAPGQARVLHARERGAVGRRTFVYEPASGPASKPPPPFAPPAPATVALTPSIGTLTGEDGTEYPLDRPYVIGRDPLSDDAVRQALASPIVIRDQQVSRVHARISIADGSVQVRDADAAGGTFIAAPGATSWDPVGATPTELPPGWSLRVGTHVFTFREASVE